MQCKSCATKYMKSSPEV